MPHRIRDLDVFRVPSWYLAMGVHGFLKHCRHEIRFRLGNIKFAFRCVLLIERVLPITFKVNGIYQHNSRVFIDIVCSQWLIIEKVRYSCNIYD
jgi:hypothetical protein